MFAQILILALSLALADAFSIPGFSTAKYKPTEVIPVFANELDSIETQLNFDYYYLPFCKKEGVVTKTEETLGGALLGETKEITPYQVVTDDDPKFCKQECKIIPTQEDVDRFQWLIDRNYSVNLVLDELPAIYEKHITGHLYSYHVGYPIGEIRENDYYIYNHLTLKVTRTPFLGEQRESRILEFGVIPTSLGAVDNNGTLESFCEHHPDTQVVKDHRGHIIKEGQPIFFSYDVIIIENNTKQFASRWDHYHKLQEGKVHWMYLISSFVISILLAIMVGYILKRTVNNDIRMYNELRTSEEIQEDSGWKQLARDVFRPPKNALLLSVFLGTGVQVGSMLFLTLGFATIGFMDHSQRGSLLTTIILLYNFMGAFAGYYSSRFYKMFNGSRWVACTLLTALLYPSINFGIFYVINIMLIFEESSAAVHIGTILELLALWLCISMPLVFFGSLIGYKKQQIKNPSKFNPIPKFIKQQPWYLNSYVVCLLGGFLPFGAIFMEYMSIMLSVWKHWFYYLFIFLFAIAIILVATCAEISIVITYLQLCSGNHRVWWRSFLATGSMALYIFAYSIFYYFSELKMERFSSIFLYFGYMFAFSLTIFILCGTIGFVASYVFVRKIYASIKID